MKAVLFLNIFAAFSVSAMMVKSSSLSSSGCLSGCVVPAVYLVV